MVVRVINSALQETQREILTGFALRITIQRDIKLFLETILAKPKIMKSVVFCRVEKANPDLFTYKDTPPIGGYNFSIHRTIPEPWSGYAEKNTIPIHHPGAAAFLGG